MNTMIRLAGSTVLIATAWGCTIRSRDSDVAWAAQNVTDDVVGTYFAADSGHNLGKNWCYSGALVLDSTRHFGSVIKMCSDDGSGPTTESIKGSYHFKTRTVRVDGATRERRLYVVLDQDGLRKKTHTLRYDNGTLRFDEPWWMGAGLRALEIPDPVLKKVPAAQLQDASAPPPASAAPAVAGKTGAPKAAIKKSSAKVGGAT